MGRDLLAEDYLLKQMTASLLYPEDETGKRFWNRIYAEAINRFGTDNIPVETFNKVWIMPEKAVVYENIREGTAYVVESRLKVLLEEDYLALARHEGVSSSGKVVPENDSVHALGAKIIREIVVPELTREVNQNKNFARLRQCYNALILASWYKKKIKDSLLKQVYADRNKIAGIRVEDPQEKERIYQRYLETFRKGVFNYVKDEIDPLTQESVPRKYFSGGVAFTDEAMVPATESTAAEPWIGDNSMALEVDCVAVDAVGFFQSRHPWDYFNGTRSLPMGIKTHAVAKSAMMGLVWSLQEDLSLTSDGEIFMGTAFHPLLPAMILRAFQDEIMRPYLIGKPSQDDIASRFQPSDGKNFRVVFKSSGQQENGPVEKQLISMLYAMDNRVLREDSKFYGYDLVFDEEPYESGYKPSEGDDFVFVLIPQENGTLFRIYYRGQPIERNLAEAVLRKLADDKDPELAMYIQRQVYANTDGKISMGPRVYTGVPALVFCEMLKKGDFFPSNRQYFTATWKPSGLPALHGMEALLVAAWAMGDRKVHQGARFHGYPWHMQSSGGWISPHQPRNPADFVFALTQERNGTVLFHIYYHGKPITREVAGALVDGLKGHDHPPEFLCYPLSSAVLESITLSPVVKAQRYVDETIQKIMGDDLLSVFGGEVVALAEILFDLEPQRFKEINLRQLSLKRFYLEPQSEPVGGQNKRPPADLDPQQMLQRLSDHLTVSRGAWASLDKRLQSRIVEFAVRVEKRKWNRLFNADRDAARQKLEADIRESGAAGKTLVAEALKKIRKRDVDIHELEKRIASEGILKGLSLDAQGTLVRHGPQLEYYQLDNIFRMCEEKKVILADETGLGKTVQMLVFALLEGAEEILIGAGPIAAKDAFVRDLEAWIAWDVDLEIIDKSRLSRGEALLRRSVPRKPQTKARIQLWHFGQLRAFNPVLSTIAPFDFVGFDEVHWIKNDASGRSRAAQLLNAKSVVLATATPLDNDLKDLRVLLKMVLDFDGNPALAEFFTSDQNFLRLFKGSDLESIAVLRALIKNKIIRNRREDVGRVLKDISFKATSIDIKKGTLIIEGRAIPLRTPDEDRRGLNPFIKQQELYDAVYVWLQKKGHEAYRLGGVNVLRYILADLDGALNISLPEEDKEKKLRRFMAATVRRLDKKYPKVPWVGIKERALQRIGAVHANEQMLVFLDFKTSIPKYQRAMGPHTEVISGDVPPKKRKLIRDGFFRGFIRRILATYATASTSSDFSPASVLIFLVPSLKGSDHIQCIGRVDRVSDVQKLTSGLLTVYDFIVQQWRPDVRSADEHVRLLEEYKSALGDMLLEIQWSEEVVNDYREIGARLREGFYRRSADASMTSKRAMDGGIDLDPARFNLEVQNIGQKRDVVFDSAQLEPWQKAPGLLPVIVSIRPLKDFNAFLHADFQ